MISKLLDYVRKTGPGKLAGLAILFFILGMLFSGGGSDSTVKVSSEHHHTAEDNASPVEWTCSMHPQIRQPQKGLCPICGMDLIPVNRSEGTDTGRTLTLSLDAVKLADIQTVPVERKFVAHEVRLVGKVEVNEQKLKTISSWVTGRIERLYVDFTGITVKKGDHMVELYSPDLYSAQQEVIQAKKSAQSGSLSVRHAAEIRLNATREKLKLLGLTNAQINEIEKRGTPSDRITIYSPMSGIVLKKNAFEGMYINTGTPIYSIVDLSQVWVKLDAYESDLTWLRYGQEVEFTSEAYPGEVFKGKIAFIDPILNSETRTVKVRVNVENKAGRLKPDMFVKGIVYSKIGNSGTVIDPDLTGKYISPMHPDIVKDGPGQCDICGMDLVKAEDLGYASVLESDIQNAPLVIPASAPLITGIRAVVYVKVKEKEGAYEGREVVLGPKTNGEYVIKSGLEEAEQVVVNGNFKIDSELQIRARPSMMYSEGGTASPHNHGAHATEKPLHVSSGFNNAFKSLMTHYFDLQSALSHDNLKSGKYTANALNRVLENIPMHELDAKSHSLWMSIAEGLKSASSELEMSGSIDDARGHFETISDGIISALKSFSFEGLIIYRYHCPMAFDNTGADWLQKIQGTENPYFGSSMFTCGSEVEIFGTVSEKAHVTDEKNVEHSDNSTLGSIDIHLHVSQILEHYFSLQNALSHDKGPIAAESIIRLNEVIKGVDMKGLSLGNHNLWMKWVMPIAESGKGISANTPIDEIRKRFENISENLYSLLKEDSVKKAETVYRYHCPMAFDNKGADWLQKTQGTENPYFGSQMFTCGSEVEVIKPVNTVK